GPGSSSGGWRAGRRSEGRLCEPGDARHEPDRSREARAGGHPRMNRRVLRRFFSNLMVGLMIGAVIVALAPLFFILANLVIKGASSLSLDFFTKTPAPAGESGGGVAHAIVGTLLIVGVASVIGLPIGIGAGIYCAEYPVSRLTWITRFVADVLNGTPSIVVGV